MCPRCLVALDGITGYWDSCLRAAFLRLEAALKEGVNSGLAAEEMVAAKAALKQYFGVEVESMSKHAVHFDTFQKLASSLPFLVQGCFTCGAALG